MTWDATSPPRPVLTNRRSTSSSNNVWDDAVGDIPFIPSMNTLSHPFDKLSELGGQISSTVGSMVDKVGNFFGGSDGHIVEEGFNNIIPKDYKALTNGAMSTLTENSFKDFASDMMPDSFKNGFFGDSSVGATEVSSMLKANGLATDSGGPKVKSVVLQSRVTGETVTFKVMPTISESRNAQYDEVQIAHHPGAIVKYNHTASRSWQLSQIKLISRTITEATENQKTLNLLRSWLMPYYGYGTEAENQNMLGAPPDVLTLFAYGDKNIGTVPVVMTSLTVDWPNDVDYIHTDGMEAFPVILNIGISLQEAWSPREFSGFSLAKYKEGNLKEAYNPALATPDPVSKETPKETPKGVGPDKVNDSKEITNVSIGNSYAESTVSNQLNKIFDFESTSKAGQNTKMIEQKIAHQKEIEQFDEAARNMNAKWGK